MTFNMNKTLSSVFMHENLGESISDFSQLDTVLKDQEIILNLQRNISHKFKNMALLYEALTHSSFGHECFGDSKKSYERLEFLGDSVLDLIITDLLQEKFPAMVEGKLSKLRASLVNEVSLKELASSLEIERAVLVGKGELKAQGNLKSSILSDVFEAVLGAIYKDSSLEVSKKSFISIIENYEKLSGQIYLDEKRLQEFDSKSRLQEMTMSLFKTLPKYSAKELSNGNFEVEASVLDKFLEKGEFSSKKKGEQKLAKNIIIKIEEYAKRSANVN